jgi:hypothetical protein
MSHASEDPDLVALELHARTAPGAESASGEIESDL